MRLSQQQLSVLKLRAEGLSIKEIADRLQLSPKTVGYHWAQMTRRLGIYDVALLTHFAISRGLVGLRRDALIERAQTAPNPQTAAGVRSPMADALVMSPI
jgi:DNA-binding CsgD family transcriptional regulator